VNACFVSGNLQKNFAVSGAAQTRTYEVGSVTPSLAAYAPLALTLATVTTAGNVIVSTTAGDHPNLGTSSLDSTKSANRFWTVSNSGCVFSALAGNSIKLSFVAGDVDGAATPGNFNVGRYNAPNWTTSPPPTPTRTVTSITIAGTTITTAALAGQYAAAETGSAVVTPGSFNSFESATGAGSVVGVIKTKVAGTAFSLDVVAINAGSQLNSFASNVKLELVGNAGGGYGADNCPVASTVAQTIASAAISGGRSTVAFAAVADAYYDVRVRISYPVTSPTVVTCSTDSFAIRPASFANVSVTDADAQTPGTTRVLSNVTFGAGGVVHKAGRAFTVRSNAVTSTAAITPGYNGAPTAVLSTCAGGAPCTAGVGALTIDTTHASGQLTANAVAYSEVGSFALQLVDSVFASIDAADGSTLAERTIQSSVINVGRFVPDHFVVSLNAPRFQAACAAGSFTYVGQAFGYSAAPVITVTAKDANNNTTTFYDGAWWRVSNATVTGKTYAAVTGALDTSGISGVDPAIAPSGVGVGTLTFSSGTGLLFSRTAIADPFDANISLSINVIDADGIVASANPVVFGAGGGIPFDSGASMRYGRIRVGTAVGSELVDLPVAMTAEYYAGANAGFISNGVDLCTTGVSIAFSGYTKNLGAGETCVRDSGSPGGSGSGCAAAAAVGQRYNEPPVLGDFNLRLAAPGIGNQGSVVITATVPTWLRYDWNTATPGDENPSGQATFGIFGGESRQIYTRELY
jgi:MSHA biogenesis protein MshQ